MTAPADAIVVLGAALDSAGKAPPALHRRTLRAAALHRSGAAPFLVLSGGGAGARSEAAAMAEIARLAGVPETALLLEGGSANTFENALMTAALLDRRGLSRVILVSDGYHLPRARFLFRLAGLVVVATAAAPPPPWTALLPLVLRETAAFAKSLGLAAVGTHRRLRNRPLTDADR
jgi:uncharacterized SAM-binding protein YcdF (DUF218 family)